MDNHRWARAPDASSFILGSRNRYHLSASVAGSSRKSEAHWDRWAQLNETLRWLGPLSEAGGAMGRGDSASGCRTEQVPLPVATTNRERRCKKGAA